MASGLGVWIRQEYDEADKLTVSNMRSSDFVAKLRITYPIQCK